MKKSVGSAVTGKKNTLMHMQETRANHRITIRPMIAEAAHLRRNKLAMGRWSELSMVLSMK